MGQMMERPVTEKDSAFGPPSGALGLSWASSCMQGWRVSMEDAHVCMPQMAEAGPWGGVALFGVMDGHGGEHVAKFCERHLPAEVAAFPLAPAHSPADIKTALVGAFHRMDDLLRDGKTSGPELRSLANPPTPGAPSRASADRARPAADRAPDPNLIGCTACFCCLTGTQIVVANAGDSRAVLCRGGKAIALSEDHKPNNPGERRRIEAAGGYVETVGSQHRVNGNLNLSRALGDLEYKNNKSKGPEGQIISGTPDVSVFDRSAEDEFLVVCCDGVWDVNTDQQVVDFIRADLPSELSGDTPQEMARILEGLLDHSLSPDLRATKALGGDNMTAVLVRFPGCGAEASETNGSSTELYLNARKLNGDDDCSTLKAPPSEDGSTVAASLPDSASEASDDDHRKARPEGPRLASVASSGEAATPGAGTLDVRLALPEDCALGDLSLQVSRDASALKVRIAQDGEERTPVLKFFPLREHLPEDAELEIPAGAAPVAKFFGRSRILRVRLPWRTVTET